ncbi:TlpA family protein disulfide reductase [Geodermatophilus sp. FMUSA9-8]|uniref:TlpA family protein disulfide reductase n=1 Tax=Geodermatophilus sp. FMUSA9-8 TaxID=3120155 RepID=UPI00300BF59D
MHTPVRHRASSSRLHRAAGTTVVVLLTAGIAGCSAGDGDAADDDFRFDGATAAGQVISTPARESAPAFGGELLDGTAFDSAELAGDVAVLNFWGSWCTPCRVETPDFQAVYSELRGEGVQFLGVDVKDQRQLGQAFVDSVGVEYPSLFDPSGEVALAFRGFPANVVPSTIVLDREGRVAAVYTGAVAREDLLAAVTTLLQEPEA